MTIKINGVEYLRTSEVCHSAGITRATFFRWVAKGTFGDAVCRDRRGWRLFTREDLEKLKSEVNRIQVGTGGRNGHE